MKILLWGINYAPESTGIGPFNAKTAEFLFQQGHPVEVITSFPYYPAWRKAPEDRSKIFRTETINGIKVHRCWHYVPKQVTLIKRILHEGSFVFISFLRTLFLKRPDLLLVVSPPLLLGMAAWLMSKLKRTPYVFHVQDLQPDAAVNLGMLEGNSFISILYRLERFAYDHAIRVSGISHGMTQAFVKKGVAPENVIYFPNGTTLPSPKEIPEHGKFRASHQISSQTFLVVYSGNLGMKQGLDIILQAALRLSSSDIKLIICGDGAYKEKLADHISKQRLQNVRLIPLLATEEYRQMLVDADVCLITQQAKSGAAFFPSKLLSTLAFGKPVLSVADRESELAKVVMEFRFGLNVLPGQPKELAETILMMSLPNFPLKQFAENGKQFVKQFESNHVLSAFEQNLHKISTRPLLAAKPEVPSLKPIKI
jgi:colanic acid biosynthesis glycosyl transferase WcaI